LAPARSAAAAALRRVPPPLPTETVRKAKAGIAKAAATLRR
jgi:hypothetical protein